MSDTKKWIPLFSTQLLGVFNDNFLKNCIIFISIFWLAEDQQGIVIPLASAFLVIPFVLFSPLAGRLAQTYSKQKIYEYAKLAEIPIMVVAFAGFALESLTIVMVALLLMGLQSAIYAPSKYGLIRDVGGVKGLSFGVGSMELLTFLGVLIGQIVAGVVSDMATGVLWIVGIVLLGFAIAGYFTSKKIQVEEEKITEKNKDPIEPFTFLYKTSKWARGIKGLNTTIFGLGGFWLVAAMIQMNIYDHVPEVYGLSNTGTAIVMALVAIGIGVGCWIAGMISKSRVELGMVPIGGIGLSVILTIFATADLGLYPFVACLFAAAFFSGFYKVPLSAWIQERVEGRKLGQALAYNQLMAFLFILLAAGIFGWVVNKWDTFMVFVVLASISWLMTLITLINIPAMMIRFVAYMLTRFYFKFDIEGKERIPVKTGALVVANHLSLLDPFLLVATVPRMLRFVVDQKIYDFVLWKWLLKRLNMVPISRKLDKVKLEEFNLLCQEEVNSNHVLCIFPEGQISRVGHLLEFRKGIEHIARGVEVPIIPIQMEGVKGVPFSFEIGSSKPIGPDLKSFRKRINITIGEPVPSNSSAFQLRQKINELNSSTFEKRISEHHTLLYFMKRASKKYKGRTVLSSPLGSITYEKAWKNVFSWSGYWKKTKSKYVGLDIDEHPYYGLIHASILLSGKIPVLFSKEMEDEILAEKARAFGIDLVVSEYDRAIEVSISTVDEILGTSKTWKGEVSSSSVCGVFFSYDSDNWNEVQVSHKGILSTIRGLMHVFEKPLGSVVFSDIPLSNSYGNLAKFWLPYFFGMEVLIPKDEEDLKSKISAGGVNALLTDQKLVTRLAANLPVGDWLGVNHIILGRDSLEEDIMTKIHDQGIFVSETIGIDELGVIIAINTPDYEVKGIGGGKPMLQSGSKKGSFGRPLPGVALKVVSEDELLPLEAGVVGRIMIKGAIVSKRNTGADTSDGWFLTDEIGCIDEDGFLFIETTTQVQLGTIQTP